MIPTIIVFGGAGFIGTHLLRRLQKTSAGALISVDIRAPKNFINGVTYITHDVRDLSQLNISGNISTIYNLAAVHTTPGHHDHEYYETNILGATEVISFARRHNVATIIFTSSISVYGPSEDTKTEDSIPRPQSPYGWSKLIAEKIHTAWKNEDDTRKLVIVRPAVIFGTGEDGNFTRLAKLLKRGFFIYPGRTDTIKACFYVEDLLDAIDYALSRDEKFIRFNACYTGRITISGIVKAFKKASFPKAREFKLPLPLVYAAAHMLRPLSTLGLGIHPDRVMKLIRSTDITPGWLAAQNKSKHQALESAFTRWGQDSNNTFT